ncbi:hypothetical protein BGW38_002048, partial [Lunasporangiospora selenospora]
MEIVKVADQHHGERLAILWRPAEECPFKPRLPQSVPVLFDFLDCEQEDIQG